MCVVVGPALPGGARCGGIRWAFAVRMRGSGRRTTQRAIVPDDPDPAPKSRGRSVDRSPVVADDDLGREPGRARTRRAVPSAWSRLVSISRRAPGREPARGAGAPPGGGRRARRLPRRARRGARGRGPRAASARSRRWARTARSTTSRSTRPRRSRGQGVVQVALVDPPGRQVAPRAGDRGRVDVGGVQLDVRPRAPATATPSAPVPQHRSTTTRPVGVDEQRHASSTSSSRAPARHEHTGRRRRSAARRTPPSRRSAPAAPRPPARRQPSARGVPACDASALEQRAPPPRRTRSPPRAARRRAGSGSAQHDHVPAQHDRASARAAPTGPRAGRGRRPRSRPARPRRARRSSPSHSRARQRRGAEGVLGRHAVRRELAPPRRRCCRAAARRRRRCRRRSRTPASYAAMIVSRRRACRSRMCVGVRRELLAPPASAYSGKLSSCIDGRHQRRAARDHLVDQVRRRARCRARCSRCRPRSARAAPPRRSSAR